MVSSELLETKNPSLQTGTAPTSRTHSFPWWGGKYQLAPEIIKHLPKHRIYVEPFGGAASVLLAKPPSPIEVYNDRDRLLVNLFLMIRSSPVEFMERCKLIPFSRYLHHEWQRQLFKEQTVIYPGDEYAYEFWMEVAIATYYVIVSSFAGDPTKGWAFDRTHHHGGSTRWTDVPNRIGPLSDRFRHVNIDNLDARDCIQHWDTAETLFYCDPPYWKSRDHGYYRFTEREHYALSSVLRSVKGRWLLSYDDAPRIRRLYKGFNILKMNSSLASKKINKGERRQKLRHILIANYPLED